MDSPESHQSCPFCNNPLDNKKDKVTVTTKGLATLIQKSHSKNDNKWMQWTNLTELPCHTSCRLRYLTSSITKSTSTSTSSPGTSHTPDVSTATSTATLLNAQTPEDAKNFDFVKLCFFCGSDCDTRRGRSHWSIVKQNFVMDKIVNAATIRDDSLAKTVVRRLDGITSLVDIKARYHSKCYFNFFKTIRTARIPSPSTALNEQSFSTVCNYIEESGKFEFTLVELQDLMKANCLDRRTLYTKLRNKYGKLIYIRQERGKPTIIYYKHFNIGSMCNKCYWDEDYTEHEKEIILKTAAQILKRDITAKEYNIESYPPATKFLDDIDKDIPDSLTYFMSALIESEQSGDYQRYYAKRQVISHSIISAIRSRTFISTLHLAVGTYIYRKTGSRQIIEMLHRMGVSVSYHHLQQYETSVILNPPKITIEDGVHLQHVFDNTDHNVSTLDGHHTFHCLGGIAIYTPEQDSGRIARNKTRGTATSAVIQAKGGIPNIPYSCYNSTSLEGIVYRDTNTLLHGTLRPFPPAYSVYIWAKSFAIPKLPSWSGFMEILSVDTAYSVSRIVCQPFINEQPSSNSTIYTALSFARSECDKLKQKTCFVTFDQPLYHKARIIIAESQERGKLENVVVRLGGFHLLMSYLGAIGYIMADSGIEALWSIVYAPQSVKQMLSGHAFSRAMRAHMLTFTALGIAIAKSTTSDKTPEYRDHMSSFLKDWQSESSEPLTIGDCQADPVIAEMTNEFIAEINRLKNNGPTAQLWLQYFELVTIALQFVEAERLGDWKLHLQCVNQMLPIFHAAGHLPYAKSAHIYLQDMAALEYTMNHEEYDKFTREGFFTTRRSDKPWSGVWSDMTIEQTLNRYFGTDLIHGRGITAGVIARYLLAMPSTFSVMECVEEFFKIETVSSEQHKDLGASRQKRDEEDLNKFLSWIDSHQPFQPRATSMSLSTGMYGNDINCHLAIAKGRTAMLNMLGRNAKNISLSMMNKVKNLASLKASIHLAGTPHLAVDSTLLFQRISVVFQGDPTKTRSAFDYELAPYPLTLFDEKGYMRKASKADLYKIFKKYTSLIPTEVFLESFVFVLDGGFLLQSVCWPHGVTYRDIFQRYLTFITHHYRGNAYVVFDGYDNDSIGMKSYERYRRGETNVTANVDFTEDMLVTLPQRKFLSNIGNKSRFINLLSKYLRDNKVQVAIAAEDADTLIVNTAIQVNKSIEGPVAVVGNDIDLLVLLIALNDNKRKDIYLYKIVPGKSKDLYSTADQDEFKEFILFAHAFVGCDTTSSIYMKGKKTLLILLQKNEELRNLAKVFYNPESTIDAICRAAEIFVLHLYGCNIEDADHRKKSLGEARYEKFVSSAAAGTSTIRLAKLPPTAAALHQHAKRVYLQVQLWLGNILAPDNWGWKRHLSLLFPIMSTASPAPQELLKLEEETKAAEAGATETGTGGKEAEQNNASAEKPTTPAKEVKEKEGRKGILNAIRLPLVSVFPRKKKEGDAELGTTGAAGLASSETLDDAAGEKAAVAAGEDGMETVRLDGDANDGAVPPKPHPLVAFISAARRNLIVTAVTLCILLAVIIIICIAFAGPRRLTSQPLKDGKYIEAATWCGPVQGVLEDGAYAFRGIPYAIPPLNNFRWSVAQPIHRLEHCWNGTYIAHNSSEMCWQREISGRIDGDENCLFLDVYTPQVGYDTPLPVVVMIGAETLSGGSPGAMQPSAKLAQVRDMVFVRPNFRLGIFGFLAAEPLSRAAHLPTSGNYGLSDIIAALKWVQLNIHHFGGDKRSVTVWGHRAGGTLLTTLLGARQARGLFNRAWISSSSAVLPTKELHHAEQLAEPFLSSIQCLDVSCLRGKSAEEIMDAVPANWHTGDFGLPEPREATPADRSHEWLVIDGAIIQDDIRHSWITNRTAMVIMGTTAQVGTPARFKGANVTVESAQIEKIVKESLLGTLGVADEALRRYNSTLKGLASMISDIRVICPLLNFTATTPFYITQSRGQLADADSDVAAILGSYIAKTPEEKRHQSAIQQLFNHFVWHGKIVEAAIKPGHRVIAIGQDILTEVDHPNCDFWMKKNIVPKFARVD